MSRLEEQISSTVSGMAPTSAGEGLNTLSPLPYYYIATISLAQAVEQAATRPRSTQVRNAKYPALQTGTEATPTAS